MVVTGLPLNVLGIITFDSSIPIVPETAYDLLPKFGLKKKMSENSLSFSLYLQVEQIRQNTVVLE